MGGGSGNESPRHSGPFNSIRMNSTEPLQLRNVSVNSAATLVNPRQPCAIPAGDVPRSIVLPVASSGTGKQVPFIPYVKQKSTFTPSVGTSGVDSCMSIVNRMDTETTSNFKRPLCPFGIHALMKEFVVPMRYTSIKQESNEDSHGSSELQSNVRILSRESRAQASTRDKLRRAKISEAIKTLQDSVPCSDPNNKDAVLDDVIDYVKFLKLQLKVLSQNRLNGEAAPHPLVYLDGYGHYLFNQQMCNEPLEEMMGQLMESDTQAAHNLLENKGLTILPMDLAYTLLQNNLGVLSEANCP